MLYILKCVGPWEGQRVLQWISQLHLFKGSAERAQELPFSVQCQIFKMQRIYMHSNEHFEVFTTVLAPQGEWNHICSEVWHSMSLFTLLMGAKWHISVRWLISNGVNPLLSSPCTDCSLTQGCTCIYVKKFLCTCAAMASYKTNLFLLIHFHSRWLTGRYRYKAEAEKAS